MPVKPRGQRALPVLRLPVARHGHETDLASARLLAGQARECDPRKREVLLHRIQQLTIDRVMFAPIMDYRTLRGVGPRVGEHMFDTQPLVPDPAREDMRMKAP